MSASLEFRSKKQKHRYKKEALVILIVGSFFFSFIFYYYYIKYSPIFNLDIPQININFEDEPNYNDFIDCTFQLKSKDKSDNVETVNAMIKIRGTGTGWNKMIPKKGYRIELSKQLSLLGMREDDDWLLMEMYSDYPRLRIKMAMDLWSTLQTTDPTAILPKSEYVCLFLNGEFYGLYLLAERNDRKLFDLDDAQNNLQTSLIFQAKGYIEFDIYENDKWDQDWPNDYEGIYVMDDILSGIINFVVNSSDEVFFNENSGIYNIFNQLNLVDFYVFNYFINHRDFWFSNYFIIRNSFPNKFFLIPWDFDKSFGQFAWNFHDPDNNPELDIREANKLYDRLVGNPNFMNLCYMRWLELRQTIWTEELIIDMLNEIYEDIESILDLETEKWNPGDLREEWRNDVEISVKSLYTWISERLIFCDSYFLNYSLEYK